MKKETWETIAHVSGVIALVIASTNLYFTFFDGPDLSIKSFPPSYSETNQFVVDQDIVFTFQLYNDGGKPAFVRSILIYQITGSGKEVVYKGATTEPEDRFYVMPGEPKEINVTIPAPNAKITNELIIVIHQESPFELIKSEPITVSWF